MNIQLLDDVIEFIEALDAPAHAKAARILGLLKHFGQTLGMPHSRPIGNRLFELRVVGKSNIRFIYSFHDGTAFILHAFVKKTAQLSSKDLALAKQRLDAIDKI